ncbi:substrate-binding domain-containing protein [uncultured Clostridium sp.]|uniref:substrate-binding domain-containing protein n=1 Tax=uncultured Clostridium sp. TaxID=59620 RepID=UPI0025D08661|nr:substrate-binding domain-containing protein [uncultured Clostridium sp.]
MKKMQIAKMAAAAAAFSLLTACGTSQTAGTAAPETKAEAAESTAAEDTKAAEETQDGAKENYVIAGIYKMGDATWFIQEGKASQEVVEAAGGTWKYMDAKQNGATYMQMIDNCIADKVDGVLVCLPDQNLSQTTVDKLKEANIPVIAVDDALQTEDGTLLAPWVGIDGYNIGAAVGEWAAKYITENGLAKDDTFGVMLLTADTVSSCVPRTEGQLAKLKEAIPDFPDNRIFKADHDTSTEQGNTAASTVITGNPQIKKWLVLGVSDEGAQGAARALEAAGLEKDSVCVGLGGYLAPDEFAKESSPFKAAAYFSAKGVGGTAAQAMLDYLQNGTPIPEKYAVDAVIVEPGDDLAAIMPEYVE